MDLALPACFAALAAFFATAGLILLAPRIGLIDHPNDDRKHHERPTPVVGGLGLLLAILTAFVAVGAFSSPSIVWLCVALVLLSIVGVVDDRFDLKWYWRLSAHVIAALLIAIPGQMTIQSLGTSQLVPLDLGAWALPFTVFAVVGVINATNMIDGMDGLAGSLAVISFVAMAWLSNDSSLVIQLIVMASAVAGFLALNLRRPGLPRAACFLGNSGSAALGLMLAWAAIALTRDNAPSPSLAPWLVALPIMDCLIQICRRLLDRRSPFSADQGHLHHILMSKGWSVNAIVLLLVVTHLILIGVGLSLAKLAIDPVLIMASFVAALPMLGFLYWLLHRQIAVDQSLKLKTEQAAA